MKNYGYSIDMQTELFNPTESYLSEGFLDTLISYREKAIQEKDLNPEWGFSLNERHCFKLYYNMLKPNEYGTWLQKRTIHNYSFLTGTNNTDLGDAFNELGSHFEIKASYSDKKGDYSFWQVRPWESLAGHYFLTIDRGNNWTRSDFFIDSKQFHKELALMRKTDFTHGKKNKEFLGKDYESFMALEKEINTCHRSAADEFDIVKLGQERLEILKRRKIEITLRLKAKGIDRITHDRWLDLHLTNDIEDLLKGTENEKPKIQSTIFDDYTLPRRLFAGNEEGSR